MLDRIHIIASNAAQGITSQSMLARADCWLYGTMSTHSHVSDNGTVTGYCNNNITVVSHVNEIEIICVRVRHKTMVLSMIIQN